MTEISSGAVGGPGKWRISDSTWALSAGVGSHEERPAAQVAESTTWPPGVTWQPANAPTFRLKPTCGRASRCPIPWLSRMRFHRVTPVSQSLM